MIGWIFKSTISRPDFYLPRYNLYVEFWGLVDVHDRGTRDNYVRTMRWKMAQDHANNIQFVSIYSSNLNSLDYYFRKKFRQAKGSIYHPNRKNSSCPPHLPSGLELSYRSSTGKS